jgi:hypothetical protein
MRCLGVGGGIRGSIARIVGLFLTDVHIDREGDGEETHQRSIRSADGVVVFTQFRRTGEVDASDGDVEFLCDADPFGASVGVCVCVVCHRSAAWSARVLERI